MRNFTYSILAGSNCPNTRRLHPQPTNALMTCPLSKPRPSSIQRCLAHLPANLAKTQCLRAQGQPFNSLLTTLIPSLVPRQRQTSDEDAPPIASVNDMLNVTYTGSPSYLQRSVRIIPFVSCGFYPTTCVEFELRFFDDTSTSSYSSPSR